MASAAETLEGKRAFEQYAESCGVTIEAYHAKNSIFSVNDWVWACPKQSQPLTFTAVGAHHQNGIAKRSGISMNSNV